MDRPVTGRLMESPVFVSGFSHPSEAYIREIQVKIKSLDYYYEEVRLGFKEALGEIERKLGSLLDLLKDVGSEKASKEETREQKRFLVYELEIAVNICHVIDDYIVRRRHFFDGAFHNLHDIDKYMMEMEGNEDEVSWFKTQMDEFNGRKQTESSSGIGKEFLNTVHGEAITPPPPSSNNDYENEEKFTVIGLEVDVQVLSQRLVQKTKEMIWIVGAEGIGKTTLAVKVFDNIIATHCFELHIWVTISPESKPRDTLLNLLKKIPQRYLIRPIVSTDTTLKLACLLLHVFKSVRCLIVFDGLYTYDTLEALYVGGLRTFFAYSKIMITTRSRELADHVKRTSHLIHEMRTLSDQDAWALFTTKVNVPVQLEKLGMELVRKCMGYPLRILALGDILSGRAVTEDEFLKLINQDLDANQVTVLHQLEVAVDSLPSHLRDCLSCFEVFSDDFDIPMRRLVAYWVAEGHVQQEDGSKEPPEILAEKQLMDFIQKNVIQVAKWKINGRVKTCRMNYYLRDFWLPKLKKETSPCKKKKDTTFKLAYFLDVKNKRAASKSPSITGTTARLVDHLSNKEKSFSYIHGDQKFSHSSLKRYYGDLCSLVSFDSREGPVPGEAIGNFLRRGIAARCFTMLRVLDLEGVFRPNLPKFIHKLLELRYLGLRRTYIEGLPSTIGKLVSLQTLDLKHACIRSLPYSVWKMKQLRHIYLSESYRSRIVAPPRTSSLVDFQTLWGALVDDETVIADGLDKLINIRKLSLVCRLITSQQKELADWISNLVHLESLRLRSVDEMNRPSGLFLKSLSHLHKLSSIYLLGKLESPVLIYALPNSLTEITISSSQLAEDPMKKLEKLPNLRILNLYAGSYIGKTMVCSSQGFPLLRILNMWKLEELEDWIVEERALAILRDLEIRSCTKLKKIPDGVKRLGACHELKLTNLLNLYLYDVSSSFLCMYFFQVLLSTCHLCVCLSKCAFPATCSYSLKDMYENGQFLRIYLHFNCFNLYFVMTFSVEII